jgi:hypothetical protein
MPLFCGAPRHNNGGKQEEQDPDGAGLRIERAVVSSCD